MRSLLVGVIVSIAGPVHADRFAQAHVVFADSCARCHSATELRSKSSPQNASASARKAAGERVRAWLENPASIDAGTYCRAARLDPVQRELVGAMLREPKNPMARSTDRPRIPVFSFAGIVERPKHVGPVLGQGDHR